MCLGIALLKKGKPCFLRMRALGKVEGATVGLVNPAVCLVRVDALNIIKQDSVKKPFVVVGLDEV